jgi:DNA-binding MarR family transcriptional regulator
VGDALTPLTRLEPEAHLSRIALSVTPSDHDLMEQVGLHPFLSPSQLADVLGWSVASVRRRMNRLMDLGLMRRLTEEEVDSSTAAELIELTQAGLELAAGHLGLSLAAAVRELGLTGGGPNDSVGPRRALLRNLAHTREVDEIFVRFHHLARDQRGKGSDDAMEEWQNASACCRRDLRPDGYGIYRHRGVSYGFFVELDRGTMNARDYFKKFAAHYRYAVSGRFRKDYRGYPMILFVTANNASEERIARVARAVAIGQAGRLPIRLTSFWRLDDPRNPLHLLGTIWREPDAGSEDRRSWLPH